MLSLEQVSAKILRIRGEKVMLDRDLAELYGVETKRLKESVRRNIEETLGGFQRISCLNYPKMKQKT